MCRISDCLLRNSIRHLLLHVLHNLCKCRISDCLLRNCISLHPRNEALIGLGSFFLFFNCSSDPAPTPPSLPPFSFSESRMKESHMKESQRKESHMKESHMKESHMKEPCSQFCCAGDFWHKDRLIDMFLTEFMRIHSPGRSDILNFGTFLINRGGDFVFITMVLEWGAMDLLPPPPTRHPHGVASWSPKVNFTES